MGVPQVAHGSDLTCLLDETAFSIRAESDWPSLCTNLPIRSCPALCNALVLETMRKTDLPISALLHIYCVIGSCTQACIFTISTFPVSKQRHSKVAGHRCHSCKAMWLKWMEHSLDWSWNSKLTVTYLKEFVHYSTDDVCLNPRMLCYGSYISGLEYKRLNLLQPPLQGCY